MKETMKGFAMLGKGETGIIEKPMAKIEDPKDVIIKTTAVSICTSDIHMVAAANYPGMFGCFIGHEAVGVVTEVGSEVKDFKVGDRVCLSNYNPDHGIKCAQEGHPEYDASWARTCDPNLEGMFAEYIRYPRADANLAHIPDNVTDEQAVIISDMGATAFSGLEYIDIQPGENIAVIGIGPVGLMGVNGAVACGAGRIFAVGNRPATLEAAKKMGATDVLNYKECNYVDEIIKLNGGPVDKVLVCGGNDQTVLEAFKVCKKGGKIGNLAFFFYPTIPIGCFGLGSRQYQQIGIKVGRYFYERLLNMVSYGRIQPELEISHLYHGIDKTPEAFEIMKESGPDVIKSVVIYD